LELSLSRKYDEAVEVDSCLVALVSHGVSANGSSRAASSETYVFACN